MICEMITYKTTAKNNTNKYSTNLLFKSNEAIIKHAKTQPLTGSI